MLMLCRSRNCTRYATDAINLADSPTKAVLSFGCVKFGVCDFSVLHTQF